MLKTLKKLAAGDYDFTPNELAIVGPRYFRFFAGKQRPDVLEKLFPHIPVADRETQLTHAVSGFYYEVEEGYDERGTLKWLLTKAEEIGVSQKFWDDLVQDEEMFSYVVAGGNEANTDLLLEYYNRYGGREAVLKHLPTAGFSLHHVRMVDKFLQLCQEWGGDEMVKNFIGFSDLSVERAIGGSLSAPTDDETKLQTAIYLLEKQYEINGAETVVDSIKHLYENADSKWLDEKHHLIVPVFRSLSRIGGNDLVKAVFSQSDYGIGRHLAFEGALGLTDEIEDIVVETQDRDFIEEARRQMAIGHWGGAKFLDWADSILEEDHASKTEEEKSDDLEWALMVLAKEHQIKRSEDEADDPKTIRRNVIRSIVESGNHEQLKKFSDLHEAYGRNGLLDEALTHFDLAIRENANSSLVELLIEHTFRNFGFEYVEDFLTTPIDDEEILPLEPTTMVATRNKLDEVKRYFDMVERIGGQAFVDKLIAGRDNHYLPILFCRDDQGDIADYMLSRLSPKARRRALVTLPEEWRLFAERKIPKHKFLIAHTTGQDRWLAVTGQPAPVPTFMRFPRDDSFASRFYEQIEQYSPYRFKPKLYEAILPAMNFAAETEGFTMPEISAVTYAYKLATLFSSEEEIDAYLHKFATTWGKESKNLLHDACLFELPDSGSWKAKKWQKLVTAYGPQVFPMLKSASGLEKMIGDDPFPKTIEELSAVVFKIKYERKYENTRLAELSAKYALMEEDFNSLLDFMIEQGKERDFLPAVRIDGADIGFPDLYMERLSSNDPLGFFLGEVSNSCQSVTGNGRDCALYGMSNPYSGFYVWRSKTNDIITEADSIVAESWLWIGHDNTLVFDSFERVKPAYNEIVQPFLEQFAHEVVGKHEFEDENGKHTISGIRLGCDASGQTPPLSLPKISDMAGPRDYEGKYLSDGTDARDSKTQYVIQPIDHRLNPHPRLPPPTFSEEADKAGLKYIASVERRIKEKYGVDVKVAIELEFYAVGTDNRLAAEIANIEKLQGDLKTAGLDFRILQGDPDTRCGQHRIVSSHGSPIQIVKSANAARKFLKENAKQYDLAVLSFLPRPYKGHEWSSASIYTSLNTPQGVSLLADDAGNLSAVGEDAIANLIAFNRHAFLSYAQQDIDYARYWNSGFAPTAIAFGDDYNAGFRVTHSADRGGLIENRLANANCNLIASVAATLAGIEYSLASANPATHQNFDTTARRVTASYPIPSSRYEALMAMKEGMDGGLFTGAAGEVFRAIARQHDAATRRPAPADQRPGQLIPG